MNRKMMKRSVSGILLFTFIGVPTYSALGEGPSTSGEQQYPFASLSVEQIHKTEIFQRLKQKYSEDFDISMRAGVIAADPSDMTLPSPSGTRPLHEMLPKRLLKLQTELMASPITQNNFDALFAFAAFTRECLDRLSHPPYDLKHRIDWASLRGLSAALTHAAVTLPDSDLKNACVDAVLDCTDIKRQCELAATWRQSGDAWLDTPMSKDPLHTPFATHLIDTVRAYGDIQQSTKRADVKQSIQASQEALQKASVASGGMTALSPVARAHGERKASALPRYDNPLEGSRELRILNPGKHKVTVGARSGNRGIDFDVPPSGQNSVQIPNGTFEIYFVYEDKPDALFKGQTFTIKDNGIEIQLVEVADGNYSIWRVK